MTLPERLGKQMAKKYIKSFSGMPLLLKKRLAWAAEDYEAGFVAGLKHKEKLEAK